MKKFLKIVAIVAVVLIAVALVVPLALKSKVGDIVKKEAGELLTAEVDFRSLDLSLLRHFPHASVELEGLTVVCAAPFEGDTLASVGRISVVVDLMSLFGDSGYEVTKLLVDKAHLHARKLADGSVNWDVMKPSDEPAEEKEPAEADEPSAFRLRMRDVRLSEAVVRYEDDSTGMRAGVDPLDLRLSGDLSGERSDLDLRLEAHRLSYAAGRGGAAARRRSDGRRHARRRSEKQAFHFLRQQIEPQCDCSEPRRLGGAGGRPHRDGRARQQFESRVPRRPVAGSGLLHARFREPDRFGAADARRMGQRRAGG